MLSQCMLDHNGMFHRNTLVSFVRAYPPFRVTIHTLPAEHNLPEEELQIILPDQVYSGSMPANDIHKDSDQHCGRLQDIESLIGSLTQHLETTLRAEALGDDAVFVNNFY